MTTERTSQELTGSVVVFDRGLGTWGAKKYYVLRDTTLLHGRLRQFLFIPIFPGSCPDAVDGGEEFMFDEVTVGQWDTETNEWSKFPLDIRDESDIELVTVKLGLASGLVSQPASQQK